MLHNIHDNRQIGEVLEITKEPSLTNQLQFFPTLCHHHGMKRLKRVNGVIEGGEVNGIHGCRRFRVKAGGVVYSYFGGRKCI